MKAIINALALILALSPALAFANPQLNEVKLHRLSRDIVKSHLKDPSSAEFRNQKRSCGEVNANNSFGGKTGFKRFIAVSRELVIMEGDGQISNAEFQQLWAKAC